MLTLDFFSAKFAGEDETVAEAMYVLYFPSFRILTFDRQGATTPSGNLPDT